MIYREDEVTLYNRKRCPVLIGCDGVAEAKVPFENISRNTQSIYGESSRMALVRHVLCCPVVANPSVEEEQEDEAAIAAAAPLQMMLATRVSRVGLQSISDLCGPSSEQLQNADIPWLDETAGVSLHCQHQSWALGRRGNVAVVTCS